MTKVAQADELCRGCQKMQKQLDERNEATRVWIQAETQTRAYVIELENERRSRDEYVKALEAVVDEVRRADFHDHLNGGFVVTDKHWLRIADAVSKVLIYNNGKKP